MASFTGCSINKVSNGYELTASSSTNTSLAAPTNAHSFNITAGALAKYAVGLAGTATAGNPVAGVTLTAEDADGNTVTTYSASNQPITWSGPQNSPNGKFTPSLPSNTVSFSGGVSTTALSVTFVRAGSQTLTATDSSSLTGSATTAVSPGLSRSTEWDSPRPPRLVRR